MSFDPNPPGLTPSQLENIQGDVWSKGFPKDNETYYFFAIDETKAANGEFSKALAGLFSHSPPLISSLQKVKYDWDKINAEKKDAEDKGRKGNKLPMKNALIAFTIKGLEIIETGLKNSLELTSMYTSDKAFSDGMANDGLLNDPPQDTWDELFKSPGKEGDIWLQRIHGVLKIAGSSEGLVQERLDEIRAVLGTTIHDMPGTSAPTKFTSRVDGSVREKYRGKEHFGFEDGISQPLMKGIDYKEGEAKKVIPPATVNMNTHPKLLIVTEDTKYEGTNRRPPWTHDGTFLVFRKLEQDVKGFLSLTSRFNDYDCENDAHMGAKLMGRWPSGAPIAVKEYERKDFVAKTKKDEEIPKQMNDFSFVDDVCPASAHIRKTNPRRIFGDNDGDTRGNRTRIIRNGIPYGNDYSATDLTKRGLLFACYQAHIEDGFQHMQRAWSNEPKFPVSGTGHDPIVGQVKQVNGSLKTGVSVRNKKDPKIIEPKDAPFQQLVTLKGGDYFFVPPISEMKDKGRLVTTKPAAT